MNIAQKVDNRTGFYYGWIMVAVSMVSLGFWFGIRTSFSVFYVTLLEEFAWDRGDSAGVQSMAMISYTILSPVVGTLIDRFGPRRIILPGILLLSTGLLLCATVERLSQFYLYYGVIAGSGNTCIGVISYSVILAYWFEKRRGLASGVAASGIGVGTFCMVPLSQYFISTLGWRITFVAIGALVLIVLFPLNAFFLRHKPRELGLCIDGLTDRGLTDRGLNDMGLNGRMTTDETDTESDEGRQSDTDWTIRSALSSFHFWAVLAFPFFSAMGLFIILVHNVKFLVDQGIDKMTAAYMFAMAAVFSTIFRIFWGWLSDHIRREIIFSTGIVFLCLGAGSLVFIETTGIKAFVYPFFIFFGMGWGVMAPMFMAVATDLFKGKTFGLIYGIVEGGIGAAGALGAWISGFIFDKGQSYQPAFKLAIAGFLLSAVFIWLAAPRNAAAIRAKAA